ncbi:MAG: N-6 DNA methylase, partial [Chlorobi bacterium]|nr:N-6 DNA methylase [Chlorobiota bacterium]
MWNVYFAEVFSEKGAHSTSSGQGFDVVIGNPPYVQVRAVAKELQKEYLNCNYYKHAKGGRLNLYQFFVPLSLFLTKKSGIICLITQNSILAEDTAINTRKYIFNNSRLVEFVSFPERDDKNKRVFEGVKMSVAISMFQKIHNNQANNRFTVKTYAERKMLNMFSIRISKDDVIAIYPDKMIIPMAKKSSWELLKKFRKTKNIIKFKAYAGEIDITKYSELFNESIGIRVYTGAQ